MDKMDVQEIAEKVHTPAFIYDERVILSKIKMIYRKIGKSFCYLLFPLKSFTIYDALYSMAALVDGFAVSSLFEAKLARDVLGNHKSVHLTTPGLCPDDIKVIAELCDYISFNSLSQWKRYHKIGNEKKCGLRINPQLSFIEDNRYDPCRKNSKLGVPLKQLCAILEGNPQSIKSVSGLLFHTNCESEDFRHLLKTVKFLDLKISTLMDQVSWINLGGGYFFSEATDWDPFLESVALLKDRYDLKVFFEPGKGIIGEAGYIVSTVVDIFDSEGKKVAILDTTVNHMPEVFEYQFKPDIMQESTRGKYKYILAGASCLAGDVFGEYRFDKPLDMGSKIVFKDMGAYTIVKAHMFNGINLPDIYAYLPDGKLELKKQFDYEDFLSKYGGNKSVAIRERNHNSRG